MTEICNIQDEIKKALPYIKERWIMPNEWLNRDTNFIYNTNKFEKLIEYTRKYREQKWWDKRKIFSYVCNRRVNKICSFYCERCFEARPQVNKEDDKYNKFVDLYIDWIWFDVKITVFPKNYEYKWKKELLEYLYQNQSNDYKVRSKNKIYVLLYSQDWEHYKLKCELSIIKKKIDCYMEQWNKNNLYKIEWSFYDVIEIFSK